MVHDTLKLLIGEGITIDTNKNIVPGKLCSHDDIELINVMIVRTLKERYI